MKRMTAVMLAVILAVCVLSPSASAASGIYAEFIPPPQRGYICHVDVYSDVDVSAAEFTLEYDASALRYRDVSAAGSAAYVRARDVDGTVTVIYCIEAAATGKLFTLDFDALTSGDLSLVLRMTQGADGKPDYIKTPIEYRFTATLPQSAASSSKSGCRSSSSKSTSSKSSGGKTYSGSKSEITYDTYDGDGYATSEERRGEVHDLSRDNALLFWLLGAGSVTLIALIAAAGFYIGRKSVQKKKPSAAEAEKIGEDGTDSSEKEDEG